MILPKANTGVPGVWDGSPGLTACPSQAPQAALLAPQQCLRAWARQQTGATWPVAAGCQVSTTAGCKQKPGLDSRPVNKLMAICIPSHDSAALYERIHCVRSEFGLDLLKAEAAEESCVDYEVTENQGAKVSVLGHWCFVVAGREFST